MGPKILVVEDHATMREAMRLVLEGEGFSIEEAADGRAAVEAIRRSAPALVFLDLNIPGGPGLDVLSTIREDPASSAIPVIVITAEGEEGRAVAMRRGAQDYLTKPFSPRVLLQAVERALAGSGPTEASP
jgi:two-component system alkaline phosphatase synthesis response regulator PhoP